MNVERFLLQVKQNLPEHEGVTTWVENSALNVGYGKSESFEIRYPGGICYNAATEKTDEFYKLVEEVAQELISAKRKVTKGVAANVDFYSGFVYNMLGLPVELFTPMFAIARMSGWCAHRLEELLNNGKIIRPAYVSTNGRNPYVSLNDRK